jgi:hypothetical protein
MTRVIWRIELAQAEEASCPRLVTPPPQARPDAASRMSRQEQRVPPHSLFQHLIFFAAPHAFEIQRQCAV